MPEHSPGCPFSDDEPPPPAGTFEAAVQAAVYAFLGEIGAPMGAVITIRAGMCAVEDSLDDAVNTIEIGIGPLAQDRMASAYAQERLNADGAPWMN
jgi:hypothetical protein